MHRPCANEGWATAAASPARASAEKRCFFMRERILRLALSLPQIPDAEAARLAPLRKCAGTGEALHPAPDFIAVRVVFDCVARADVLIDRRRVIAEVLVVD